ncbi:MAG: aspartate aminotransferase [Syntrophaceae bacterium CG2_30_49_12]|nr:MAG: aspartate aminotransferase [Syntrophaceae bacterium CG2_30_49_12]PIP07606.1 MAG: aspartate aminotransferase [Syntrophobacterales bacterium CG23_combo_of_CG06-09_8_20_14_all_48_27]PJA49422.1 MAG: aspartate aminotransferase [Syntrophobacterales bacterium CG_4_9_14_3_um_filter_49_8]PJC77096.1 MAG: aspartate aminotransferase [Syntrophobacterales bacterium CG_4_8_14_3_um_filter_49_14]
MKLSSRISGIKPSPTLAITMKANALRAEGRDVIGFGAGEPDFDTPLHIKMAAIKAIEGGFTKYTPVGGTDELKDAIIRKLQKDNRLNYSRSEIVVSCGAKHTLYNLAQVLFEEGDEVIIPSPYWVSYPDIVVLAGAQPVVVETKETDGFKLQPEQLEGAINKRTKAVILNSPSNPTGAAYSRTELEILAEVIGRKGIFVISDDIYEKIIYDDFPFCNIASISEEMKKMTVVVNGVSKAYAMTGWRIGYAAGPSEVISAVTMIQSQSTSNPSSISQKAAVEALVGDQDVVTEMVEEFRKRRNCIVEKLGAIPGITCMNPAGAFYVFPNVSLLFGRSWRGKTISNSSDLTEYLLEEANVAVVPGGEFGCDHHIRLSYATSMKNIEEGLQRIRDAVVKLD